MKKNNPPAPPLKNNLETRLTYRQHPKLSWRTIQRLGTLGGGLNAGIATTRFAGDPLARTFVEKTFTARDVAARTAHKEIALLKQVGDHGHITRMYDHFVDVGAGKACVYMEYCELGSLYDVIVKVKSGEGRLVVNEHKVWEWLGQMLEALVYCHLGPRPDDKAECLNWAAVYHRDIKPANILLTRDKTTSRIIAKLADFGCAISDEWAFQTKDMARANHASAQTPGFDPPEFPRFSGTSDVWQLALVFVCVCSGEKASPRSRSNPRGKPWDPTRPAGATYSGDLNRALGSCLLQDWKRRPGALKACQTISAAYARVQKVLPVEAQPLELLERTIRPVSGIGNALRFKQHVAYKGPEQPLQGPRLPGHILSDLEAGKRGRVLDHHNARRSPQGPYSGGRLLRGMYSAGSREDEDELLGARYQHRGFCPPFHSR